MKWPHGKRFAFTVFDDTDRGTKDNLPPVYDLLAGLGFRTTKSVWPVRGEGEAMIPGDTCEDPEYLEWVLSLQQQGFEIGFHNATYHTSLRGETLNAIDRFNSLFGHDPLTFANHASNGEAIYWGRARLSGLRAYAYDALRALTRRPKFSGHDENSPLFWGDICRDRVRYVRNFVFSDINTLAQCPQMPYRDPDRPFVNLWFASTEGGTVDEFCDSIESVNQDRLEEEGGACIMYTHFGKGFVENGKLHDRFARLMTELAARDGWFPTTVELLDYLRERGRGQEITQKERVGLENRWLRSVIKNKLG
ncbi:MAG: hypothetical protein ACR2PA_17040 [Hyphomicrobiaceae bacterium]